MLPTTPAAIPRCTVFGVRNSWVWTFPGTIGGGIGIVVIGMRSGSRSYVARGRARRPEPEAASPRGVTHGAYGWKIGYGARVPSIRRLRTVSAPLVA